MRTPKSHPEVSLTAIAEVSQKVLVADLSRAVGGLKSLNGGLYEPFRPLMVDSWLFMTYSSAPPHESHFLDEVLDQAIDCGEVTGILRAVKVAVIEQGREDGAYIQPL
jgi:hypothetical protein